VSGMGGGWLLKGWDEGEAGLSGGSEVREGSGQTGGELNVATTMALRYEGDSSTYISGEMRSEVKICSSV